MVDIHTHILPQLDDGSESIEESLELLKELKNQGVTDVIATPHFYPQTDNSRAFKSLLNESYNSLKPLIKENDLPRVHLGCELLYYQNIGHSDSISQFCLLDSKYLLLELTDDIIGDKLFEDLFLLKRKKFNLIIAHLERYSYAKNFRKLLKFIKEENILAQINASSVLEKRSYKVIKKLIKKDIATFIATDTHSLEYRPPEMSKALEVLTNDFGEEYTNKLINNSINLLKNLTENEPYAKQ